jgi:gas vesicle protein
MNSRTKIALGLLGAAAAGVALGMILAPEKGSEIRHSIKKTANKWVDQVGNIFSHAEENLADLRRQARSMKADAESHVNRLKEELS